jgi:hypothetical protein
LADTVVQNDIPPFFLIVGYVKPVIIQVFVAVVQPIVDPVVVAVAVVVVAIVVNFEVGVKFVTISRGYCPIFLVDCVVVYGILALLDERWRLNLVRLAGVSVAVGVVEIVCGCYTTMPSFTVGVVESGGNTTPPSFPRYLEETTSSFNSLLLALLLFPDAHLR